MERPPFSPGDEIKRLQRCINDLVSVLALPAIWTGAEPGHLARTLVGVLLGMLDLDLVYVRVQDPLGAEPVEVARVVESRPPAPAPAAIGEMLRRHLGDDPQQWPPLVRGSVADGDMAIAPFRLGLSGELGVLIAGSARPDFPQQTERLLLSVAANQAALGLQVARLLSEQKGLAQELDRRVAQRTAEVSAANEELRNTQAELAHLTRMMTMGELTASIAHEVNQPLAGIITNASTCLRMLAADPPNIEGARETARRTIRDGNRASDVITRLRALFSKKEPAAEPVDLNEATQEVIALVSSQLQRRSVSLRLELAHDLPLVSGDRVQLQQVILNLIRNASDAMSAVEDRPRELLVKTGRDEDDLVRVTVRDTGPGVDPQAADRLFEAFYTTKSGGMGVGLSVSRSIVESHHGRLWAASNDGPGATFAFSIPLPPTHARPAVRSQ